ncbi:MAG: ankyrin repeat domain-containing protein [Bradyrhizobiaceae bacterium]|nr:ankyrin repeat domain-containing protein [Bradyrhizobiaceae bacterium]
MAVARDYGFASWRALKDHVDEITRKPVFAAARAGDVETVRHAFEGGLDPSFTDADGCTVDQIGKTSGNEAIERLARDFQGRRDGPVAAEHAVTGLLAAGARLDFVTALNLERYEPAEAMLRNDPARIGPDGGDTIALHLSVSKNNAAAVRWLIAQGADVNTKRTLSDCSHTALHMTAESGALDIARLLLDAGADPNHPRRQI